MATSTWSISHSPREFKLHIKCSTVDEKSGTSKAIQCSLPCESSSYIRMRLQSMTSNLSCTWFASAWMSFTCPGSMTISSRQAQTSSYKTGQGSTRDITSTCTNRCQLLWAKPWNTFTGSMNATNFRSFRNDSVRTSMVNLTIKGLAQKKMLQSISNRRSSQISII